MADKLVKIKGEFDDSAYDDIVESIRSAISGNAEEIRVHMTDEYNYDEYKDGDDGSAKYHAVEVEVIGMDAAWTDEFWGAIDDIKSCYAGVM